MLSALLPLCSICILIEKCLCIFALFTFFQADLGGSALIQFDRTDRKVGPDIKITTLIEDFSRGLFDRSQCVSPQLRPAVGGLVPAVFQRGGREGGVFLGHSARTMPGAVAPLHVVGWHGAAVATGTAHRAIVGRRVSAGPLFCRLAAGAVHAASRRMGGRFTIPLFGDVSESSC